MKRDAGKCTSLGTYDKYVLLRSTAFSLGDVISKPTTVSRHFSHKNRTNRPKTMAARGGNANAAGGAGGGGNNAAAGGGGGGMNEHVEFTVKVRQATWLCRLRLCRFWFWDRKQKMAVGSCGPVWLKRLRRRTGHPPTEFHWFGSASKVPNAPSFLYSNKLRPARSFNISRCYSLADPPSFLQTKTCRPKRTCT